MKQLFKILALLSLVSILLFVMAYHADVLTLDQVKLFSFIASIGWFVTSGALFKKEKGI